MDINTTVIAGTLAAPAELREFDSGSQLARILVTTRTTEPTPRVDVVPVTIWEPDQGLLDQLTEHGPGARIWVAARLQRRFWSADEGRRSRLEVVAMPDGVQVRDPGCIQVAEGV